MSSSNDDLDIMIVSQLLPVTTFRLSPTYELKILPASSDLETFFATKHDTYTAFGARNFFKIYGMNTSYNHVVMNFYYEYATIVIFDDNRLGPNDRPQYRTAIDFRSRLSTFLFGTIQDAIEKHLSHLEEIISSVI
jgi:hypothetical protein